MIDNLELAENMKEAVEDYPFKCHSEDDWSFSLHKNCKARKWLKVLDEFYQQAAEEKKNDV